MRYDIRSRVKALSAFSVLVLCVWGASYVGGRTTVAERPINLTKEGYRLMAIDEGKTGTGGGLSGGVNAYFYFQKMKYVK